MAHAAVAAVLSERRAIPARLSAPGHHEPDLRRDFDLRRRCKTVRLCVSPSQARGLRGLGAAAAEIIGTGDGRSTADRSDGDRERAGWTPAHGSAKVID